MPAPPSPQSRQDIDALIRQIAQEEGVNPDLAVAMARQESGLNPNAVGDGGHSVGLFQLHDQGMGAGMGQARYDPATNARTALRSLAQTIARRPDLASNPGALAAASQRPADAAGYARSINAMLGGQGGTAHAGSPFTPGALTMAENQPADQPAAGGPPSNRLKTLQAQRAQYAHDLDTARTELDTAMANRNAIARRMATNQEGVSGADLLTDADQKAADKAVADAQAEVHRLTGQIESADREIGTAQDTSDRATATANKPPAPKSLVQNFGSARAPDWRAFNPDTGAWEKMPDQPAGEGPAPTTASERAASGYYGAAAANQQAQAGEATARADASRIDALAKQRAQDLARQAQQDIEAALAQPPGPDRDAAVKAATEKWTAINSPEKFLELGRQQAQQQFDHAKALSDQTGIEYDPATLQPMLDEGGQPKPTLAAQQQQETAAYHKADLDQRAAAQQATNQQAKDALAQRAAEAEQTALGTRQQVAAGFARDAMAAETAHQQKFLPAEAAQGLAPLYQSFATGQMPAGLTPTILPAREAPAEAGQRVFQAVMEALAPHSPGARAHLEAMQAQGQPVPPASVAGAPPPPPAAAPLPQNAPISPVASLATGPVGPAGAPPPSPTDAGTGVQPTDSPAAAPQDLPLYQLYRQLGLVPGQARAEMLN